MTTTVADLRAGLRANIKATVPNLQVSAYILSSPSPPGVHIFPGETRFDLAMNRGLDEYDFVIQAFVAWTTDQGSQSLLDDLRDPIAARSLKAAIESDLTLGGHCADLRVVNISPYRNLVTMDNRSLLVSDWTVTVYVDSSA